MLTAYTLASITLSFACAWFVGSLMRPSVPGPFNLAGSVLVFASCSSLLGWLFVRADIYHPAFGPSVPAFPWYTWVVYALLAGLWYGLVIGATRWIRSLVDKNPVEHAD